MLHTQTKLSCHQFNANRAMVALVLIAVGCAGPTRTVVKALDPANPEAEIQTGSAQLTPLTAPGPEQSDLGLADSGAHASHDMSAMRMPEPSSDGASAPAGHDMAGMKMPEPAADKPKSGHDMAGMKMPQAAADKPESGKKPREPAARAATTDDDMMAMRMSGETGTPREGEEHLKGVVTGVVGASINVTLEKGAPTVVLTDKATAFERGEAKTNLGGIQPGERIVLYGNSKGGKWLARVVKLSVKPTPGPMRASPKDVNPSPHDEGVKMPDTKNPPKAQEFTCPMHPEVRSPTPGKCPKCGMTLKEVVPK